MSKKYVKSTFTTGQLAKILEVTDETIRNWIKKGFIDVIKLPSGRNQISITTVKKVMREYSIPEDRLYDAPKIKILLADIDDSQRLLFRKYFEGKTDYLISNVKNSLELGITIVNFKPDVLLLDLDFTDDIKELIEVLKKNSEFEGITIVLVPFNRNQDLVKTNLPAVAWLEKPYTFEDLKECIDNLLKTI